MFGWCCRRSKKAVTAEGAEAEMEVLIAEREALTARRETLDSRQSRLFYVIVLVILVDVILVGALPNKFAALGSPQGRKAAGLLFGVSVSIIVLCFAGQHALKRCRTRVSARLEAMVEDRKRLLVDIKTKLPMHQAVELLRRYDPNGKHEMMVSNPALERTIETLQLDRARLLRVVGELLSPIPCPDCSDRHVDAVKRIQPLLQPFAKELPQLKASTGNSLDAVLMNLITGKHPNTPATAPRRRVPTSAPGRGVTTPAAASGSSHDPMTAGPRMLRRASANDPSPVAEGDPGEESSSGDDNVIDNDAAASKQGAVRRRRRLDMGADEKK